MPVKQTYLFEHEERSRKEIMSMVTFLSWSGIKRHLDVGRRTVQEIINYNTSAAMRRSKKRHPWKGDRSK